ncbi:beta-ketoacyl synthase N-terminal-like domain-containing protein [Variovorax dokdonensis]|uniref:Beta-ketoacyl synthase N-terminal-like domain-containing protein n=1 Tax=Variovorax dokdonensis TaxID=344883 RepID=A0ABT7NAQ0_9BURK|nr:beta-ketoacyl synthase N-terminal-like domain-containing protein [Variovorax dokdonensis]
MSGTLGYIVGFGASTPVGRDAWSSAAAVRAGISGFVEHPYQLDSIGQPVRAAIAPWLDIDVVVSDRFELLLIPAVGQALAALPSQPSRALRVGLALGVPGMRPGVPPDISRVLLGAVAAHFHGVFSAAAAFPQGHAAGLIGLQAAAQKLRQGQFDAFVIAGVDSYIDPDALEWLEACDQLHSAGAMNNAWGFIPGEAAGAVLVVREEIARDANRDAIARILAIGAAEEVNRCKTESVCLGEGLTAALRDALVPLADGAKVTDVYCDMNGEPYRADEYGFAGLRTKERFDSLSEFVAPADCWGDVGAAGAPLHLMLAAIAGAKGYSRGELALTWASAEAGERAAALLATRKAG